MNTQASSVVMQSQSVVCAFGWGQIQSQCLQSLQIQIQIQIQSLRLGHVLRGQVRRICRLQMSVGSIGLTGNLELQGNTRHTNPGECY